MIKHIPEMPSDVYHSDPCPTPSLSSSCAWTILNQCEALAYAKHPRLGSQRNEPTDDMAFGSLVHSVVLGKDFDQFAVISAVPNKKTGELEPVTDWRKDAAKKARDEALAIGKTPVLQKDVDRATVLADAMRSQLDKMGIDLAGGATEEVLMWEETASSGRVVQCRARLDWRKGSLVRDLKSCDSAHPRSIQSHVEKYGYHVQEAAYTNAVAANFSGFAPCTYEWIFVESSRPHVVVPSISDGELRACGAALWQKAVDRWDWALHHDEWPGYVANGGMNVVKASPWTLAMALGEAIE